MPIPLAIEIASFLARYYEALKQNGNRVTYVKVEGATHGDTVWFQKPIIDKVVTWFKDNLK